MNVGESRCNSGDGTDERVQSLMFTMIMMMMMMMMTCARYNISWSCVHRTIVAVEEQCVLHNPSCVFVAQGTQHAMLMR